MPQHIPSHRDKLMSSVTVCHLNIAALLAVMLLMPLLYWIKIEVLSDSISAAEVIYINLLPSTNSSQTPMIEPTFTTVKSNSSPKIFHHVSPASSLVEGKVPADILELSKESIVTFPATKVEKIATPDQVMTLITLTPFPDLTGTGAGTINITQSPTPPTELQKTSYMGIPPLPGMDGGLENSVHQNSLKRNNFIAYRTVSKPQPIDVSIESSLVGQGTLVSSPRMQEWITNNEILKVWRPKKQSGLKKLTVIPAPVSIKNLHMISIAATNQGLLSTNSIPIPLKGTTIHPAPNSSEPTSHSQTKPLTIPTTHDAPSFVTAPTEESAVDRFVWIMQRIEEIEDQQRKIVPISREDKNDKLPTANYMSVKTQDPTLDGKYSQLIHSQIVTNWHPPPNTESMELQPVLLHVFVGETGEIHNIQFKGTRTNTDIKYQALVESAYRAVRKTKVLRGLPLAKYEQWRELRLNFRLGH